MSDFSPVFLLCSERSGSNLIRVMLGEHPDIFALPPKHFIRDIIARSDCFGIAPGQVLKQPFHQDLRDKIHGYLPAEKAQDLFDQLRDLGPRGILKTLYHSLARHSGARVMVIKENELHRSGLQIMDAFPQARFIFQVRDPRDFMASAITLKGGGHHNKFGSFRNALRIWEDDQRFGLNVLGYLGPERVFFQRYEDLVSDPERVLSHLCGFLGLGFDPRMLSYHQNPSVQADAERVRGRKNTAKPLMKENFNKYRAVLSDQQIAAIEAHLAPLMQRFGYGLENDPAHLGTAPMIWPSLVEPEERSANQNWSSFYFSNRIGHHRHLDHLSTPLAPRYPGHASQVKPHDHD